VAITPTNNKICDMKFS